LQRSPAAWLESDTNVRDGSWLRENAEIEFADGNFVSSSINLKNKRAGDGCRNKTIEKTILRAFRPRTFSRSQGHSRRFRYAQSKSDLAPITDSTTADHHRQDSPTDMA
jgi:hypothetical protein